MPTSLSPPSDSLDLADDGRLDLVQAGNYDVFHTYADERKTKHRWIVARPDGTSAGVGDTLRGAIDAVTARPRAPAKK